MLIRKGAFPVQVTEHFKGGEGCFRMEHILSAEQMGQSGRLFGWGTLEPGHSVGWHVHHGDMEVCCCVSGNGVVIEEDGAAKPFEPGDVNVVPDGCGHEIRNTGSAPLTYLAVVLYPERREGA